MGVQIFFAQISQIIAIEVQNAFLKVFSQICSIRKLFGTFLAIKSVFSVNCSFVMLEIFIWVEDFIANITIMGLALLYALLYDYLKIVYF